MLRFTLFRLPGAFRRHASTGGNQILSPPAPHWLPKFTVTQSLASPKRRTVMEGSRRRAFPSALSNENPGAWNRSCRAIHGET